MTQPDYSAFIEGPEKSGDLSQLHALAEQQAAAEAEVAKIEAELNAAKERLRHICEVTLPAAMDQLGMEEFKTTSGLLIRVSETIRASIPKARQPEAFQWLKDHGNDGLIKRKLVLSFGKGEDEQASKAQQLITNAGFDLEMSADVHPATLSSFVKEKLEAGEDLPLELFGVFRQRVSKIEVPKEPKAKKPKN